MFTGVFFLLLAGFVGVFAYKQSRLEQKLIKDISLVDWLGILIYPLVMYVGVVLFVKNILARPHIEILDYDDFTIFVLGVPFLIYAFVGNSIHFVSKALSRHMGVHQRSLVFRINEIFHGKLSHYLTFINSGFVLFMLVLLEVNHPVPDAPYRRESFFMIITGLLLGMPFARSVFLTSDMFRGNRPLFLFISVLFLSIGIVFYSQRLSFVQYPVSVFVSSIFGSFLVLFALRRFMIQFHLTNRKRLRFLTRLVWA